MSEKVLNQILTQLKELNTGQQKLEARAGELVVGQKELQLRQKELGLRQSEMNQVLTAVRTNQEVSNAKLEGLTLDVRRLEGTTIRIEKKMDEQFASFQGNQRFLNHRLADVEMDVEKLKTV